MEARSCGSNALMLSTVSMMFAPGCRNTIMITPGLPFDKPAVAQILDGILTFADVAQPDRRAIVVGDDQRLVFVGLEQLVGWSRSASGCAVRRELPFGRVRIGRLPAPSARAPRPMP